MAYNDGSPENFEEYRQQVQAAKEKYLGEKNPNKNSETKAKKALRKISIEDVISKRLSKRLAKKAEFKKILKKTPRVTVMVNQPVYTEDKSRFFKENYEKEKRKSRLMSPLFEKDNNFSNTSSLLKSERRLFFTN